MRFLGWRRRRAPQAGRHSRVLAGPSVPGAAAALVQSAAAEASVADALPDAVPDVLPDALPSGPAPTPVLAVTDLPSDPLPAPPVPVDSFPVDVVAVVPVVPVALAAAAPVTLGFADGASVELAADDPRVRTFRAAAAALLDAPRV